MIQGVHFLEAAGPEGMRIYAIGDVHGRYDRLARMHELIADDLDRAPPEDWRIVHLGDYVDRGPQSREVIDLLAEKTAGDDRMIALCGNHDEGFLDFLDAPTAAGLFANYGGDTTAWSYGVELKAENADALMQSHAALSDAVPLGHLDFLRALPRSLVLGDFFFCHAGIRPGIALDAQDPQDLVTIRRDFLAHPGLFEKVIVHGHTPQAEPEVMPNRVNVDTRAYASGRLTALVIDGSRKRFLVAEG